MSGPEVVVIANPVAGRGKAATVGRRVVEAATRSGRTAQLVLPESAAATVAVAEDAVERQAERIVAVGGDGLIHCLLRPLVRSQTALGIVAAGTGNDAARGLGLPKGHSKALRVALCDPSPCDVLACTSERASTNGGSSGGEEDRGAEAATQLVLTVAAAGFPVTVNRRANQMTATRGSLRYTASTLLELPRLSSTRLRLTLTDGDGQTSTVEKLVSLLAVANTRSFGGGTPIAPDADPTDGLADIIVIDDARRRDYVRVLPAAMAGGHIKNRHVSTYRAAAVKVEVAELGSPELWGDGEPLCLMPASIEVIPRALTICGLNARS